MACRYSIVGLCLLSGDTPVVYCSLRSTWVQFNRRKMRPLITRCRKQMRESVKSNARAGKRAKQEGWPNKAVRLAGLRRVTQQGVILYMMDGPWPPAYSVPYQLPGQELPRCELMEFPAAVI
jgi:hypothetical protein